MAAALVLAPGAYGDEPEGDDDDESVCGGPDSVTLTGLVRDFRGSHEDFDVTPPDGLGHYAGNVSQIIGSDGAPLQVHGVTNFEIDFGTLVPGDPYAARLTVLGAEITSGGTPVPVTIKTETDSEVFEPFGLYDDPSGDGNVNDGSNPRHFIYSLDDIYASGTPISVTATSWLPQYSTEDAGHDIDMSNMTQLGGDDQMATLVTLPEAGTVTSITARLYRTSGDNDYALAIYDDNGGEPGDLIVQAINGNSAGGGWNWSTMTINDTWLPAGDYWLAVSHEGDGNQAIGYETVAGFKSRRHEENAVDNGFAATWDTHKDSWDDRRLSIYMTYTSDTPTYSEHITAKSGDNSPQVIVLRDGSSVPSIPAFQDQTNLAVFVEPYVNVATGKIVLQDNQAIYLFEIGTTNLSSAAADFQDLVMLVTLATDPVYFFSPGTTSEGLNPIGFKVAAQWTDAEGNNIAPHTYTPGLGDSAGASGVTSSGGVTSPSTFYQWFRNTLGENLSVTHDMTLTRDGDNCVYRYATNNFHPVDGTLYGNEEETHNNNFTFAVNMMFTYDASADQFFQFEGGDGAWLFVNGRLLVDQGGVRNHTVQVGELDRMGLVDGERYMAQLFYANRNQSSRFRLHTNVFVEPGPIPGALSGSWD